MTRFLYRNRSVQIDLLLAFKRLAVEAGLDALTVTYCLKRLRAEGVQFLTVTLPKLSKALLRSLELGYFDRSGLTEFRWKGRLLLYFRRLLLGVFDTNGIVLDDPDVVSIYALRQVCEYCYKLAFSFSSSVEKTAEKKFEAVDNEVGAYTPDRGWVHSLRSRLTRYYPGLDAKIEEILSKHRPRFTGGAFAGSTYCHVPYYLYKELPSREVGTTTRAFAGMSGLFRPYPGDKSPIALVHSEDKTSEVLFVPKDSRGPRVIAKEPMHMLRAQMSYFDFVSSTLTRVTHGRVNFRRQDVNQNLAYESSKTRKMATLDLKDASDRVQYRLVRDLFSGHPGLRYAVTRFRSTHCTLPSGRKRPIYKLAGMGSGLTFPTMALLIHLSVCTQVELQHGVSYAEAMKSVYVYGDDLIVPREWWDAANTGLEKSGLVVNREKSFRRGFFRESCGGDYYKGNDVGVVRLRLPNAGLTLPSRQFSLGPSGVLELERHCRELIKSGWHSVAEYYYEAIERALAYKLPKISGETPFLGRYTLMPGRSDDRKGKYLMVGPIRSSHEGTVCPYKYLGKVLRPSLAPGWMDALGLGSPALAYGELTIPRKVKYRTKTVPRYQLSC